MLLMTPGTLGAVFQEPWESEWMMERLGSKACELWGMTSVISPHLVDINCFRNPSILLFFLIHCQWSPPTSIPATVTLKLRKERSPAIFTRALETASSSIGDKSGTTNSGSWMVWKTFSSSESSAWRPRSSLEGSVEVFSSVQSCSFAPKHVDHAQHTWDAGAKR